MQPTSPDGMLTRPRTLTPQERARINWALRDDPPVHPGPNPDPWTRLPLIGPLGPEDAKPAPRQPWEARRAA